MREYERTERERTKRNSIESSLTLAQVELYIVIPYPLSRALTALDEVYWQELYSFGRNSVRSMNTENRNFAFVNLLTDEEKQM